MSGINSRKTHCLRGHAFTSDNLLPDPKGYRRCRICMLENQRKRRASAKAANA